MLESGERKIEQREVNSAGNRVKAQRSGHVITSWRMQTNDR
jgi:hypothetical protein